MDNVDDHRLCKSDIDAIFDQAWYPKGCRSTNLGLSKFALFGSRLEFVVSSLQISPSGFPCKESFHEDS